MNSKLSINKQGRFHITNVNNLSYTYFPMCNTKSMKSSISPSLGGDTNIDQNSFLLLPTSVEDLENSLLKRHIYFRVNDRTTWSVTGQTPAQILSPDRVDLKGDFLVHEIIRKNNLFTCTIESFVPSHDHYQELHKITVKNTSNEPFSLKSVIGIPIYGRSAENIRDHRHVTSLLNRVKIVDQGMINHPTFSFDERGHLLNQLHYGVFAQNTHDLKVKHYYPTLEDFRGEGETLLDPLVVKNDLPSDYKVGDVAEGYEAIAGMAYENVTLKEDESISFTLALEIADDEKTLLDTKESLSVERYEALKAETKAYWQKELETLNFHFPNDTMNGWLKWVTLQPILRRIYGNSFMPHHDYGRGGKGWRDLWQDLLALILMNPKPVKEMLINNFKGVRIDGSNATIIGDKPGEFIADRNNIARIWMDHGSWPLLTTKLFLDQSGELELLLEKETYFQDQFTHYTKKTIKDYKSEDNILKTSQGKPYKGSILEHLLIQNIVPYYNVGKHNNLRLEDADWNDGLDMASEHGESVAFTSFYAHNLLTIADLLKRLNEQGTKNIELLKELDHLLTTNVENKTTLLKQYFDAVETGVTGETTTHDTLTLAAILKEKGETLLKHVRENEWLEAGEDGWFNGYYDNDGNALDNIEQKHMTLTGQVFSIMCDAATDEQTKKIIKSTDKYLYEKHLGGYLLNTNFNEVKTNMGRLFGFAYGHKENGAMFSHMAMMYANGLYKRGFVKAGYKVIQSIYEQSIDLKRAKMYPGIPEYFDAKGRGMYSYLTGSASWLILTMVTEVFGVKSDLGHPVFEPKLLLEQFEDANALTIETIIGQDVVEVTYQNPLQLNYDEYSIQKVLVDGKDVTFTRTRHGVKLDEKIMGKRVDVVLGNKDQNESELL